MKYFIILFMIFTSILQGYDVLLKTIITASEKDFTKWKESDKKEIIFKKGDTIYLQIDISAKSLYESSINKIVPVTIYIPTSTAYDVELIDGDLAPKNSLSDLINYLKNEDVSHYFTVNTFVSDNEYTEKKKILRLRIKTKKATTINISVLYPEEYKRYNYKAQYTVRNKRMFLF